MSLDEQLNSFDDMLRRLTIDYDIFFAGGRKLPPSSLRFKVEALIKRLMDEQMSYSQKFKYNQLVAKFSLYKDVWRRNTQEMEEGGKLRPAEEIDRLMRGRRKEESRPGPVADRLALTISDPAAEGQEVLLLYRHLVELRKQHGEQELQMDFQGFQGVVKKKVESLLAGGQCKAAELVVFHDPREDRVRLQVRALPAGAAPGSARAPDPDTRPGTSKKS